MATQPSHNLRSKLARVKGLGAAHHGVAHWWQQRLTALALIPLTVWFLYSLVTAMHYPAVVNVAMWFSSPVNALATALMLAALFIHAKLGVQVVVEDYVKHPVAKYLLLLCNTFGCILLAAISILAVLKLHFLNGSGV